MLRGLAATGSVITSAGVVLAGHVHAARRPAAGHARAARVHRRLRRRARHVRRPLRARPGGRVRRRPALLVAVGAVAPASDRTRGARPRGSATVQTIRRRRERARPPRVVRARRVVGEVEVEHEPAVLHPEVGALDRVEQVAAAPYVSLPLVRPEELATHLAPALPRALGLGRRAHLGVQREAAALPVEQVEHIAHGVFKDRQPAQPRLDCDAEARARRCSSPAVAAAPAAAATRPVSGAALLAIDRSAGFRNYLPTRMLSGFTYASWSQKGGVLHVSFRNKAGRTVVWTVAPMTGACDAGKQKSFQLAGNKVWWAQDARPPASVALRLRPARQAAAPDRVEHDPADEARRRRPRHGRRVRHALLSAARRSALR